MNNFKDKYYTDQNGNKRRKRQSKKERLKERWLGREEERFSKTGRGNVKTDDVELVKNYLRSIHPDTARKFDIAKSTGLKQDRVLIILNLLSGVSDDDKDEDAEFVPRDFLVYDTGDEKDTRYGIFKDKEKRNKYEHITNN